MAEEATDVLMKDLESLTRDPKATEDCSEAAAAAIAQAQSLANGGRVSAAIDALYLVEKKARQACDAISTSKICQEILRTCKNAGDWPGISSNLTIIAKRHGQLKRSTIDAVELAMSWIDDTPTYDAKIALIDGLSSVTAGKIFVEVQRARLIRRLAAIRESEGKIDEAAALLEDVQVETFGGMERREKTEFILEQMRLVLAKNDFIRCQIISKKINPKLLESADFQDIKLLYYKYMVCYYLHENEFLQVAKAYQAMYNTPSVKEDPTRSVQMLESYVLYLILSSYDNERLDLLNRVNTMESKVLAMLPDCQALFSQFLTFRLIPWPLNNAENLRKSDVFASTVHEGGEARWELLRKRVIQHNIKTLEKSYSEVTMDRVAEFLRVDVDEAESQISELVASGFLYARIDRPARRVSFAAPKDAPETLNSWSNDLLRLVDLVEKSCHLVEKERMVHSAKLKKLQGQ